MWVTQYKQAPPTTVDDTESVHKECTAEVQTQIQELERQVKACTKRFHTHKKRELLDKIEDLKQRSSSMEPTSITPQKRARVEEPTSGPPQFKSINDTYAIPVTTQRNGAPMTIYLASTDICNICQTQMLMIGPESLLSCPTCGRTRQYLDATSASTAYGEEVEFSSFSYKRSNHFQEWLNSFQAKETTEIPDDVFQRVMNSLFSQRINDPSKITTKKVREILKDLKLRKYYEHVTQITCRLNGQKPPRMTPEQEEQCRLMFMAIQGPFEKHCPPDRKNFLSYSYCLYKFCELMAYDEFLPCFALLKGRDKLFRQDSIFRKICQELHWEFIPSI